MKMSSYDKVISFFEFLYGTSTVVVFIIVGGVFGLGLWKLGELIWK
jgi:hypothetical protein